MKISFQWLNEFISMSAFWEDPQVFAHLLAQGGLEVENFEDHRNTYKNIKIGKILEKKQHPNAERLTLCKVQVQAQAQTQAQTQAQAQGKGHVQVEEQGQAQAQAQGEAQEDGTLSIICGAANHQQGDKVVVALPGAILPSSRHSDKPLIIQKTTLRGLPSEGMLCSYTELDLPEEESRQQEEGEGGIVILPSHAKVGQNFGEAFALSDIICELKITPNRADCLSHYGLARELSALLKKKMKWTLEKLTFPNTLEGEGIKTSSGKLQNSKSPASSSTAKSPASFSTAKSSNAKSSKGAKSPVKVALKNEELCACYFGQALYGVQLGPSPFWLRNRLRLLGLHSINNVVDITNYVLHGLGQPLHAFDLDKLKFPSPSKPNANASNNANANANASNNANPNTKSKTAIKTISVEKAQKGEIFLGLNENSYCLQGSELTIRDGESCIALAGVVGGKNSAIGDKTQNLFIESACFAPQSIRATSSLQNLQTDSSYRFTRGVDPQLAKPALAYALSLLQEFAGAQITCSAFQALSKEQEQAQEQVQEQSQKSSLGIKIEMATLEDRLGYKVTEKDFVQVMEQIGCQCEKVQNGVNSSAKNSASHSANKSNCNLQSKVCYNVRVPSYRQNDLKIDMDLVEEYARIHGYHFIGESLPPLVQKPLKHNQDFLRDMRLASLLEGKGFYRVYNFYLNSQKEQEKHTGYLLPQKFQKPVSILNPLSTAQDALRQSLFHGLFQNLKTNVRYQIQQGDLFEIGPVFFTKEGAEKAEGVEVKEKSHLAFISWGGRASWWPKEKEGSVPLPLVFHLKGVLESLLMQMGLFKIVRWKQDKERVAPSFFHSGQCLYLEHREHSTCLGFLGTLHPGFCEAHKIDGEVAFAELDLAPLTSLGGATRSASSVSLFGVGGPSELANIQEPSRQPRVARDLCIVLSQEVPLGSVLEEIQKTLSPVLKEVELFDIYQDQNLKTQKKKSVAFHLIYQGGDNKTLKEKQINQFQEKILLHLKEKFGSERRFSKQDSDSSP